MNPGAQMCFGVHLIIMRILTGSYKGKQLKVSKNGIRPTRAIVRSAIFNILGERINDASVVDIFAGTGAMGIEALSRGARFCIFIEKNPATLLKNIKALNLNDKIKVIKMDFRPGLKKLRGMQFDIVFVDPPYKTEYLYETLELLYFYHLLKENSIVVVEYSHFKPCPVIEGYEIIKEKKYGDTKISFLKLKRS
jgi:16S rRNA (guanine966-N2)-methyltransferase|uniref:16S rRNA (Guanine(966)-N(2))-methyltransferase RsmD n=1 Tax=candidate division WOR-3 bacterium TaxID=2052148 RepID=A0A7C6EGP9_UNCW3